MILLVEDNEDDVFLMEIALRAAGVTNPWSVVTDGQEAMDYLKGTGRFADRQKFPFPKLMFLDLKLPYRSGLDILKWLREQPNLPETQVVVLSSSSEPSDLQRAYALGAKTYLVKPPTREMICNVASVLKLDWLKCHDNGELK